MAVYTTIDKPSDFFNVVLYTGNVDESSSNGSQAITGVGFQPDWVWIKPRTLGYAAGSHNLTDSVRGAGKGLFSDLASAEYNYGTSANGGSVTAFGSDGFTLGGASQVNEDSNTYVAWNWKAGTSFTNDASSTSIGTIDSAGSFNNDSGFSIVSYTGNNTSGATLKHGLNTAPAMVILRSRNLTNNRDWVVYHQKLTSASYYIYLNTTGAMAGAYANFWNNTAPNSSVITLGSGDSTTNGNGDTYIAYCFAEKQGYSKFSSYTGNGNADGTFVYTGFRPAWIMQKSLTTTYGWQIYDNRRTGFNGDNDELLANTNAAETDGSGNEFPDFLSNGFKLRNTDINKNADGVTYIYMAFAENPFVTSTGVSPTAR